MKVVVISGYFNPLHVGHLDYIENAKKLGDYLIVIINLFFINYFFFIVKKIAAYQTLSFPFCVLYSFYPTAAPTSLFLFSVSPFFGRA